MIQRIQTVFLLGVVLLTCILFTVPLVEFVTGDTTYIMNAYKTFSLSENAEVLYKNIGIGATGGLIIAASLIAIFLFKKRQTQLKVAKFNLILIALQITAIMLYSSGAEQKMDENVSVHFQPYVAIPIISFILGYLAVRYIKKDDEMVRSANRLR